MIFIFNFKNNNFIKIILKINELVLYILNTNQNFFEYFFFNFSVSKIFINKII